MACLPVSGEWKKANKPVPYPQGQPINNGDSCHSQDPLCLLRVTKAKAVFDLQREGGEGRFGDPTPHNFRYSSPPPPTPPTPLGSRRPQTGQRKRTRKYSLFEGSFLSTRNQIFHGQMDRYFIFQISSTDRWIDTSFFKSLPRTDTSFFKSLPQTDG